MVELIDPLRRATERWRPRSRVQEMALNSLAELLCFGGAAGSLKSATIIVDAVQERDLGRMRAIIFRRTYDELTELIDLSRELYPHTGAIYNETQKTWRWPSGAVLRFRHLDKPKHKYKYQGMQASYLGFDESTHWDEPYPRYLLSRARSTDPNLRIRARFATNPGGIGAAWHKHVFLRGVCPHCQPDLGPVPGQLYMDRTWQSDNVPIGMSVAFIPGKISDHELFGPGNAEYVTKLKTQSPATAAALLSGCWHAFEGMYFDCIRERDETDRPWNKIKRQLIGDEWWWPHWVGVDFGFSVSHAVACLFTLAPDGRIYMLDCYIAQKERPDVFGETLARRWVLDESGKRRDWQWQDWYLSPDCFDDRDGSTMNRAHQMNAVLDEYGFAFRRGTNDRAGAATRIYALLQTGMFCLASPHCDEVYAALASRVHDPDRQDDFLKVRGELGDDCVDATKIGLYSWILAGRQPKEQRIAEEVQGMDPLNAFLHESKLRAEIEKEEAGGQILWTGGSIAARRGWRPGRPVGHRFRHMR